MPQNRTFAKPGGINMYNAMPAIVLCLIVALGWLSTLNARDLVNGESKGEGMRCCSEGGGTPPYHSKLFTIMLVFLFSSPPITVLLHCRKIISLSHYQWMLQQLLLRLPTAPQSVHSSLLPTDNPRMERLAESKKKEHLTTRETAAQKGITTGI
uniref:Putative secreted peptide n=1 Tax=Anopheles braziliensis TaxID=58242 RepID=A0A2M3ZND3_9DIPT